MIGLLEIKVALFYPQFIFYFVSTYSLLFREGAIHLDNLDWPSLGLITDFENSCLL